MTILSRRPMVIAAAFAVVVALLWPSAASAHGGARISINHDGKGSVWVTVKHDDGHEADDFIDASLTARESSGTAIEPTKLVQSSSPGTLVYMGTLPTGTWAVEIDFGAPIARLCTASFVVGTTNEQQAVSCDPPKPVEAIPLPMHESNTGPIVLIAIAVIGGVLLAVIGLLLRRRRPADTKGLPRTGGVKNTPQRAKSRT